MTTNEFEAYKSEIELKMNGMKNHAIACKLAGIESLVKEGLSDSPAMVTIIEQEKANINNLLKGESIEHFGKSKEFKGCQTIGG
jgi:hypothetical protein